MRSTQVVCGRAPVSVAANAQEPSGISAAALKRNCALRQACNTSPLGDTRRIKPKAAARCALPQISRLPSDRRSSARG